jgi:enamine deaminase RidA (YjgF/YER057c/UK114 family)
MTESSQKRAGLTVLQPPGWPTPKGYSNGIMASGRQVYVGGMVGWDETESFQSDDFIDQVRQALKNIVAVLAEAGAEPAHVVRMTWYVSDKQDYLSRQRELGDAYRSVMGYNFPAMALLQISGFVEDGAKVEIEATAVIPD